MVEGCEAQVRRWMGLSWPDVSFLMLSIPEGENKRGAKVGSTLGRVGGISINLPKSPSTSVGAREVRSGREGQVCTAWRHVYALPVSQTGSFRCVFIYSSSASVNLLIISPSSS